MNSARESEGIVDLCKAGLSLLDEGLDIAIATVIETWGTSPVPVGGQMVIGGLDRFAGSVSGGSVENDVIVAAMDALENGGVRIVRFEAQDPRASVGGSSCAGQVTILIKPYARSDAMCHLKAIQTARDERRPLLIETDIETGGQTLIEGEDPVREHESSEPLCGSGRLFRSGVAINDAGREVFRHFLQPVPRMVLVGAGHISQVLAQMLDMTGYEVIVIDPREGYANGSRFPGIELVSGWPDEALDQLGLDAYSGVAALSHVPEIDDQALLAALDSDAFYIGALGSRRNHARRCRRLAARGLSDASVNRVRCPIGLNIGAATPAEIAVAVIADVILSVRGEKREPSAHEMRLA